jgi:hypothetical protein
VLGHSQDHYGIWDRMAPGAPIERFPRTDEGWRAAWTRFAAMEPSAQPVSNTNSLGCTSGMTTTADDPASASPGNEVTVYACFPWVPPLAGILFVPSSVTMRAVITEVIQRQQ